MTDSNSKKSLYAIIIIAIFFIILTFLNFVKISNAQLIQYDPTDDFTSLMIEQSNYYNEYNKYIHIPPFSIDNDIFQVDEYKTPSGQIGFIITITDQDTGYIYKKGYGPEASVHTKILKYDKNLEDWITIDSDPVY